MDKRVVTIAGVHLSVGYTPQIVAMELGYFRDEGLRIEYHWGDPEGMTRAVALGRADFALAGLWRPMLYTELGEPHVAFAQLNAQFEYLVFARVPAEEFDWSSLRTGKVLLTTASSAPWFAMQELLRVRNVDVGTVGVVHGLLATEARYLFKSGVGDLIELHDLDAVPLLADPDMHIVATWRTDVGSIPHSVYFATPDGLRRRKDEAVCLTRALFRAQQWTREHTVNEIADVVSAYAPDLKKLPQKAAIRLLLETLVKQGLWETGPRIEREAFERWSQILLRARLLSKDASYTTIIDEEIAAQAMDE